MKPREALSEKTLKQVLDYGNHLKDLYYKQQCDHISYSCRQNIADALETLPPFFDLEMIIEKFAGSLSINRSEKLYESILSRGIIHLNDDGLCSVPIPSLKTF
ncbi:MAG: hypothetical protein OXC61_07210 [Flavobacteriaceae bacterium]|nr:hypothetical protein [Flavobacteriaceae bacterium]